MADHFPKALSLEDQGRFAIGYYHERAHVWVKKNGQDGTKLPEAEENGASNE